MFSFPRKSLSFFSFQITQELANHIKYMKEYHDFARPEEVPNWRKWSTMVEGSAE